jgi:deazaflavin-dependent oxidoreductase (nitroreductase family)
MAAVVIADSAARASASLCGTGPNVWPMDAVRHELADDPTIDITTTGRKSGRPRRIEIWMLDVDGRFFITGTPGLRDWLANVLADPSIVVHLKRRAHLDVAGRASVVTDPETRRRVLEHLTARWYRSQASLDDLIVAAPLVEVIFESDSTT